MDKLFAEMQKVTVTVQSSLELQKTNAIEIKSLQSQTSQTKDEIKNLRSNVQASLDQFRGEIGKMKEDMVTKNTFDALEVRHAKLEAGGIGSSQVSWLKDQVNRLDPSNKCLCISNFGDSTFSSRKICLEKLFAEKLRSPKIISVESIWQGPKVNRTRSDKILVELSSRAERETVLKSFSESSGEMKDVSGNILSMARAKSSLQLKRNAALRRASTMIEKDAKAKDKEVKIEWLLEGSKKRVITVAGQEAFAQEYQDTEGEFLAPFQHLHF